MANVLAALYHRARTGEGQKLETSLFSTGLAIQAANIVHIDALDGHMNRLASAEERVRVPDKEGGAALLTTGGGAKDAGSSAPLGLAIGNYGGSGIGLSTAGDAVNIFDGSGTVVTRVDFVASTTGRTFDNAAGLNNVSLTQLSSLGVNGAFNSVTALTSGVPVGTLDIGSPGSIAAVPEPETYALLLAGLALIGSIARRRKSA